MAELTKEQLDALVPTVRMDDLLAAACMTGGGVSQLQAAQLDSMSVRTILAGPGYGVLSAAYEKDGLFAAIIDRPAEDAMAAGFKFHKKASQEFKDEVARLELDDTFTDALRFSRLHGGCILVPVFIGQVSFSTPLSRSRKTQIDYFDVITLDRVSVAEYGADGMPLIYDVQSKLQFAKEGASFKLHASRCIYVYGRARPWRQTDTNLVWPGVSEGQRCLKCALRLSRAFQWSEKALERKQQGIFKMKGLAVAIQQKMQDVVTSRLNLVDSVRSILNTIAIDADDEYDVSDTNLSSISDTLDSLMQENAATSGIPITVLFGRRTTSLNAKGDGDTDTYYRMLGKLRTTLLRNPLQHVVTFLSAYVDTSVPDGETLIEIGKLESLSEFEEADIQLKKAQALKANAEAVVLLSGSKEVSESTSPAGNAKPPKPGDKPTKPGDKPTGPVGTKTEVKPALITPEEAHDILFGAKDE